MIDWRALHEFALRGLKLRPDLFWSLTPYEFTLLSGLDAGGERFGAARLSRLMELFPDGRTDERQLEN